MFAACDCVFPALWWVCLSFLCLCAQAYLPCSEGYGAAVSVRACADGRTFVTGHTDGTVHVWEASCPPCVWLCGCVYDVCVPV